jgi:aldehyde dehydrogenase (NAD+)
VIERGELLVGGRWSSSTDTWEDVICPSTEDVAARVRTSSTADIDQAVTAARSALARGDWARQSLAERADVVRRAADLLDPQAEAIGQLITTEMGAPLALFQVVAATHYMRSLADAAETMWVGEARPGWLAWGLVEREPVGVVGSLAPWNGPFHLAVQKSIAALLAGCSVVFRPAVETPLDAFYLAEALIDAGLPEGVLSVIPGGTDIGRYLVAHPGVDMVDFTGSTAAGRQIGATCGQQLKRVHLELGGKSAAVVLDDADMELILPALGQVFMNSGQVCAALTRVLAPASMYDDVVDGLASVASALQVGDPFEQTTEMGPLVSKRQLDRVKSYITRGDEEGAKVAFGGGAPAGLDRGFYV